MLEENGFDTIQHETIRQHLQTGRIGLSQNRFPTTTTIEDVTDDNVYNGTKPVDGATYYRGEEAIRKGEVAVVSLAAGVGSRWTEGAGVVKGLHPFCKLGGRHRSFIETHLAKSRKVGKDFGKYPLHVITSSYLTHQHIRN